MNHKLIKALGILFGTIMVLTFFSKSFYNYRLPVVTVSAPKEGRLNFTVTDTAEISYSRVDYIYGEIDGRVREILAETGDTVKKGQCLIVLEEAGSGERIEITAQRDGVLTSVGVRKGMYVSSMQNIILYSIAQMSQEWMIPVFLTDEQMDAVDEKSSVTVQVKGLNQYLKGIIASVNAYADQSGSGYQAVIKIISDEAKLAGKRAAVTIKTESEPYDTIIPKAALKKDATGYYVLVLKEDTQVLGEGYAAHRISVDVLDSNESFCAVRGLPSDELVIVEATDEIRHGSNVFYVGDML